MPASVAVADRWHKTFPRPGDVPCKCGRGRNLLYPSAEHGHGDRWQVQWRDPQGRQRSRNRPKREGSDPGTCAEALADKIRADLRAGTYVDPRLKEGTFAAYAEPWRKTRVHDANTAGNVERRLRLHVYEDPERPGSGHTIRGGPALGHLTWAQLQQFTSLTQAWISGLTVAPSTANLIIGDVSAIFAAAIDDGLISRDPVKAKSVNRPKADPRRATAWTEAETVAMEAQLPPRYRIVQRLGPATAMRQGELFALDVDDVDFLKRDKAIRVRVQLRRVAGRLVFSPLKNGKDHDVPIADELAGDIAAHLAEFPAAQVTLPWDDAGDRKRHGKPVTRRLIVSDGKHALDATAWTRYVWKPALARAGLIPPRRRGERTHAPSRERGTHAAWRHTGASQWLADGVEVTAVAEWMGDTVRMVLETYAHMLPSAGERGRAASARYLARLAEARACSRNVPSAGTR